MLNAKNGVITEERFQKLTTVQWLFHYLEIKKFEKEKNDSKVEWLKIIVDIIDQRMEALAKVVYEANEMSGCISNPKLGKEILGRKQLEKDKAEIKEEDFEEIWTNLKEFIPPALHITGDNLGGEGIQVDLERFNEFVADELEKENNRK